MLPYRKEERLAQQIIKQIMSCDDGYFVIVKMPSSYPSREYRETKMRVVGWALVETGGVQTIEPLVLSFECRLCTFVSDHEWKVIRER